ncbi:helix-turn-helix domain-containing protein [Arthrobacter sp. ZGTC212]|uniref:helix-turn-helix domain-containing protein n=1 Tax=Arthrobacter sp. ZGTC212 TaxID=2058899 RepID=UPI000CE2BBF3|nr:XRE family transcriptional regulator [Arthrobacter sp. ZGTC212]
MQTNELVSRNIRRFRLERDLSLGELAARAGLSKQTLSKVEAGVGNPTVETLERIGQGLGVGMLRLLTEWGTQVHLSPAAGASWRAAQAGQARHLDRVYGSGYVRTQLLRIEEGTERRVVEPGGTGTLHQLYVISGVLEAGPEADLRILGAGDFLRFPGDVRHGYRAVDGPSVSHLTTTAPSVPQFVRQDIERAEGLRAGP